MHCSSLKMYAAVIVGLVALLIPGGHCRPQKTSSALQGVLEVVQLLTTSSIDKRQITIPAYATCIANDLQDVIANSPQDCAAGFSLVTNPNSIISGGAINQDAITAAYRLLCQPRCGDPLIALSNRCNASRDLIDSQRRICARNSAGRLCYELVGNLVTDLTRASTNCNSQSCTSNCRSALTTLRSSSGCCINLGNITTLTSISTVYQYSVWSGCGVDTPGFCNLETSSPSSARVPKFVKALFLLTVVVMAMLLL